ncbi:hypothetical protein GGI43DRAFT_297944 [Trichoderma evansii]
MRPVVIRTNSKPLPCLFAATFTVSPCRIFTASIKHRDKRGNARLYFEFAFSPRYCKYGWISAAKQTTKGARVVNRTSSEYETMRHSIEQTRTAPEKEAMHNARYGVSVLQGKQVSECDMDWDCAPCRPVLRYAMLTTIPGAVFKLIVACNYPCQAQLRETTWVLRSAS